MIYDVNLSRYCYEQTVWENKRSQATQLGQILLGALSFSGLVSASYLLRQQPLLREAYIEQIFETDKSFIHFFIHNAYSNPNFGSIPLLADNQFVEPVKLLDTTPLRSLELDIYNYKDELIINHGNYVNYFIDETEIPTLERVGNDLGDWIDRQDKNEALFLNLQVEPKNYDNFIEYYDVIVGDVDHYYSIYFADEAYNNDVFRSNFYLFMLEGSYRNKHQYYSHEDYYAYNENRTLLGDTLTLFGLNNRQITTKDIDALLLDKSYFQQQAGLDYDDQQVIYLFLDKLSEYDPRLIKAEYRDELLLRDEVEWFTLLNIDDDTLNAVLMSSNISLPSVMGIFSMVSWLIQMYRENKKIKKTEQLFLQKALQAYQPHVLEDDAFIKKNARQLLKQHVKDSLLKGLTTAVSASGSLLFVATALPAVAPVLLPLSLATGLSIVATSFVHTGYTSLKLKRNLKQLEKPIMEKMLEKESHHQLLPKVSWNDNQNKVDDVMSLLYLFFRGSSLSKYGVSEIGVVSSSVFSALNVFQIISSSVYNFKKRNHKIRHLEDYISEIVRPNFHKRQKRYLCLFGKTRFQRFIQTKSKDITPQLGLSEKSTIKKISKALLEEENAVILKNYMNLFLQEQFKKKFSQYLKNKYHIHRIECEDKALIKNYFVEFIEMKVKKYAYNNTMYCGMKNAFLVTSIMGIFGFILAPLFVLPFLGGGISLAVSHRIAKKEKKKIKCQYQKLLQETHVNENNRLVAFIDSLFNLIYR